MIKNNPSNKSQNTKVNYEKLKKLEQQYNNISNHRKVERWSKQKWEQFYKNRIILCKKCRTKWHFKEPSIIYYYYRKIKKLPFCPKCNLNNRIKIKNDYNIRKVRFDKEPLTEHRKITRERVKRFRQKHRIH